MSSIVPVIAAPLLDPERMRISLEVPAGLTLAEIIQIALPGLGAGPGAGAGQLRVTLVSDQGTAVIPAHLWMRVRPNPGVQVVIRGIPGDDALRTVLLIAVSAAALAFAPGIAASIGLSGAFATGVVAAGLTVLGTLLVNALIPVPVPDSGTQRDVYQINGWRNEIRLGQPVPLILGRHRYAPPFAATSWTEIVGDDQYVRALFCVGYGPVRISDIRIGDTSVDDYEDVDVEVREGRIGDAPLGLYPRQVLEEPFGVELVRPYPRDDKGDPITRVNTGGGVIGGVFGDDVPTIETPVVRWTAVDVAEISVLIGLPAGLFRINDDAQIRSRSVAVRIRARLNGVGDWTEVETLTIRAKKRESFVRQFTWGVATRGRYQVEITRMSDESLETNRADRTILAAIQSIRPEYPLHFDKPLALIAMRIKATAQLNGALDAVNCIAEHEGLLREGEAWVPGYGRTPATAFLTALMGPANPYPVVQAEIDMDLIADWHDWCLAKGLKYDRPHDQSESLAQMLLLICAAGRATPRHDGLRWGVVIDRPQELVVDHINPRNSAALVWSRSYFTPPDGMRVRFLDETNDYQEAERIIPWPGHVGPINLTEALDLPGKTDPDEIWRETRRRMYELIHRPDQFSALQDGASRVATRGDQVMGSFDILERTQSAARVKAVTGSGVEIDAALEIGDDYGVRFRTYADDDDVIGASLVRPIAASSEATSLLWLTGTGPLPEVGALVHIGPIQSESIALRLRGIEPGENLTSRLLMVAAAPQIDALTDADLPPAWDGRVGEDVSAGALVPTPPVFDQISVGTVEGGGANTVEVLLKPGAASAAFITGYEVDHRLDGTTPWTTLSVLAGDSGAVISDYALSDTIELRARAFAQATAGGSSPIVTFALSTSTLSAPPSVPGGAVTVTDQVEAALIEIASGTGTDIAGFQIYRVPPTVVVDRAVHAVSPGLTSAPSSTVSYTDTVAPGDYEYWVEAFDAEGRAGALDGPHPVTVTATPAP